MPAPRRLSLSTPPHARSPSHHPARGAIRHAIQQLAPETIEQIARRVAEILRSDHDERPAGLTQTDDSDKSSAATDGAAAGLLTAAQLAQQLGVNRSWVYQHAKTLGAITLGDGPKARLRFDLATATQALKTDDIARLPAPPRARPRHTPRRPHLPDLDAVPLLPINRPGLRGILTAWGRFRSQRRG